MLGKKAFTVLLGTRSLMVDEEDVKRLQLALRVHDESVRVSRLDLSLRATEDVEVIVADVVSIVAHRTVQHAMDAWNGGL